MATKKRTAPRQIWTWVNSDGRMSSALYQTKRDALEGLDCYEDVNGSDEGYRVVGPYILAERTRER